MMDMEPLASLVQKSALLGRAGRLAEAVAIYEQVLARNPDLPDCWYDMALLQRKIGRADAALASYQQALDRGVARPEEVHLNRGVIYSDDLRNERAAECELLTALRLNPNYVPALLNLANLNEDRGARDEALALYERILDTYPQHGEALARYANLKSISRADDPLVDRLREAVARPGTAAADKASLGFALGKVLDDAGAFDQAFEAYAVANRLSRQSASPREAIYDRNRQERFVDQLIATFGPERFGMGQGVSSKAPIFVCGMFRSGSTLVEQVLASHPRVTAGGEVGFLPAMVQSALAPFPASMARVSRAHLAELAKRYLSHLSEVIPGADRITDKRPDNFLYIGLIKALFPDAKIVHTMRNPLDNCLSIFFLHLDHGMSYALDLMDTGHYYRQYRRLMAHWKTLFCDDILDFDYDAFVREPRPAIEKLLTHCGLDWHEACLSFHEKKNLVKTASVWQVREPLYARSSGRWRNYAKQVEPLADYLNDLIASR